MSSELLPATENEEFYRCGKHSSLHSHARQDNDPDLTRADVRLEEKINQALSKEGFLRFITPGEIELHVKDGIVYLSGHINSVSHRTRIEAAIQRVSGVVGNRNYLVADDDLVHQVASSLSPLESAHQCKFFTGVSQGVVILTGVVKSLHVRKRAEQCVSRHENVRGVINAIRVTGLTLNENPARFVQPPIGKSIYFLDGVSGVVQKVVINPDNRQVIAMTLVGQFDNIPQSDNTQAPKQIRLIPRNVMGHLTKTSGFLTIASTDTKQYQEFNQALFANPESNWKPPYPYCPEHVLFPVDYEQLQSEEVLANDSLGG